MKRKCQESGYFHRKFSIKLDKFNFFSDFKVFAKQNLSAIVLLTNKLRSGRTKDSFLARA